VIKEVGSNCTPLVLFDAMLHERCKAKTIIMAKMRDEHSYRGETRGRSDVTCGTDIGYSSQ
jgi:hypothetical protein